MKYAFIGPEFPSGSGPVGWCLAIAPQLPRYHLPAIPLPSCSTGEHRTFENLCLSLISNFSWVCGRRRDGRMVQAQGPDDFHAMFLFFFSRARFPASCGAGVKRALHG